MKKVLLLLFVIFGVLSSFAQSGEISGKVKDDRGDGIPFANVAIVQNGVPTGRGTQTDFDGNYSLKPLPPGKYDVQFSFVGYQTVLQSGVLVAADKTTFLDQTLGENATVVDVVEVIQYKVPLIDAGQTSSGGTVTQEEIAVLPTRNVQSIASSTSGVGQADEGKGLTIKGGREDATAYYVDGIRVRGASAVPANAISSLTVVTGGVPAKYGDVTGGVINITTRGPSREFHGGVEAVTSQFLDRYGYNLVNANLTGPIYTNKKTNRTILGFFLAGEYERNQDQNASAVGSWKVKDDKFEYIRNNPLSYNPDQEGFILTSESLTSDDLEHIKTRPNIVRNDVRVSGKLDIKPSEATNITIGGTYNWSKFHDWVDRYTLLNYENNPLNVQNTYRGFIRFTHNIGGNNAEEGESKKSSAIQNIYYSIQADYEKYKAREEDDSHGDNFFDYGYIGKFDQYYRPVYSYGDYAITDDNGNITQNLTGWHLVGQATDSVIFTPGDKNEYGTKFTEKYFELAGEDLDKKYTGDLLQIQSNLGLINGQRSDLVHSIWYNSGRQYNGYTLDDNDQYSVKFDGSFDILKPGSETRNKHAIEFGFQFEQRYERTYTLNPLNLWGTMRLYANRHISQFDVNANNPTLLINGTTYAYDDPSRPDFTENDTILVDRIVLQDNQSYFDKTLRTKLGLDPNGTDFINIDALDPDFFTLDMLSADEMFLGGNTIVTYAGYNHLGQKEDGSFNEFFTKKDENGNFTRVIPAYKPIYIAGYIQDKFQFKDLTFNVGVRVDRFDANQSVLRDQYSLYKVLTVDEYNSLYGTSAPSTVGGDYKVYVNDSKSSNPTVVGYRDGDNWYDANGSRLSSGILVAGSTVDGTVNPALANKDDDIKGENFNPDNSFEDYKPQINVMPRLQFSFNLTDKSLFFAHYDILTQRPQASISGANRLINNPYQWYFFEENAATGFTNNPNLQPEKTIDFQLGFKQKVSNTSAITLSAFYREFKNQVQVMKVSYSYPVDGYTTIGNRDFGTTKGFSVDYDMRRTGNLLLKLNYSLQFAEGTGSSNTSQQALINANQPNLRTISPLDYDARHTINATIDWRYGSDKDYNGPYIGKQQIFSNAGINFTFSARSGTPYTKQANPTPEGLSGVSSRTVTEGEINGARKPWTFRLNTRINKDFSVQTGKKNADKDGRSLDFSVYLLIQNLLNAKNVLSVYRYTGNASDDGYLTSPIGQLDVSGKVYPESYVDLYNAYIDKPGNYSRPISIKLGLSMGF